jgi:hypothetical protein
MKLPALRNSVPTSIDGMSVEDYIRNATRNLQNVAAAMPSSGNGGLTGGAVYLNFNGNTGAWTLNKEVVDPKSLGRILVPEQGLFEGMIEWANGSSLQKCHRPLRGVAYDEPMTDRLLKKPLSPGAYRTEGDGPKYMMGFIGAFYDDNATVVFEHSSGGGTKAVNALSTTALQAVAAFGELVHCVIELGSGSYEISKRTVFEPKLNVIGYVTDVRVREADVLTDKDIITRPTASRAKLQRQTKESPAI